MERITDFLAGTGEHITVGHYEIRKLRDGSFWFEHESGEGTQISRSSFERLIEDFYDECF